MHHIVSALRIEDVVVQYQILMQAAALLQRLVDTGRRHIPAVCTGMDYADDEREGTFIHAASIVLPCTGFYPVIRNRARQVIPV